MSSYETTLKEGNNKSVKITMSGDRYLVTLKNGFNEIKFPVMSEYEIDEFLEAVKIGVYEISMPF